MKKTISDYFAGILKNLGIDNAVIVIDVPENSAHGDYTSNVAMINAGHFKAPPMIVAQKIVDAIILDQRKSPAPWFGEIKIAPPGFINVFLSERTFSSEVQKVLKEKERYGAVYYSPVTQMVGTRDKGRGERKTSDIGPDETVTKASSKNNDKTGEKSDSERNNIGTNAARAEKEGIPQQTPSRGNTIVNRKSLLVTRESEKTNNESQKRIIVEFAHPNTHKAFHIGHLRNITTGESIIRLLESQGYHVIRANYQGDVGMHIAKALYALLNVSPFKDEVSKVKGIKNRVEFLGKAYAAGSKAFEEDEKIKEQIKDYNYFVYASAERFAAERGLPKPSTDYLSFVKGDKSIVDTVYALWKETRQWSLDYFDTIYKRVYSHYDRFYFESECLGGVDTAKNAVKKGVLEESDGAIIFRGKDYGLDTRVFVNSLGLPTYEAKELALAPMEATEFGDVKKIIHCVGPEQASFFKVTFKVEELLGFVKPDVQYHLAYGWVKLKHGKMSSRLGNVVLGEWLIDEVKTEIKNILLQNNSNYNEKHQNEVPRQTRDYESETADSIAETIAIGAIKYAFLKVSTPSEIAFDLKESINTNGDSGPYLQYAYARCRSVLRKATEAQNPKLKIQNKSKVQNSKAQTPETFGFDEFEFILDFDIGAWNFNQEERSLARRILQFSDVVSDAASRYAPNTLCTYLFQLAQEFSLFYSKHQIVGNTERVALTEATAQVLKNGLYLLGINVLERM